MEFLALILSFIFFIVLHNRMNKIEDSLEELKQKKVFLSSPLRSPVSPIPPIPPQRRSENKPSALESFFTWFSVDWPLKAGAFLIILGFVWLVTYAFLNNWIGPSGRIVFGLITGSIVLALGDKWITKSRQQGVVLVGLGASIMMVTIWAAQSYYSMFPPVVALELGAFVMILTAVSSIRHDDKSLITISLVIGGLAPLLTGSKESNYLALYSYLLIVMSGALWVVYFKEWRFLTTLSLLLVTLYSLPHFFMSDYQLARYTPGEMLTLHFFAVTFSSLFYFASILGVIRKRSVDKPEVVTAVLVGFFALGWINGITPDYLKSMVSLSVSIAFMAASYIAFQVSSKKEAVYMYVGTAIMLLLAATAYAFDGPVLVMALAAESAALPIVLSRLLGRKIGLSVLLYFLLPMVLSFDSFFASSWNFGILHNDFYSLLSVTAALFIAGLYFYYEYATDKTSREAGIIILIAGSVYALSLLWLINQAAFDSDSVARMVTLTIYIVIGLMTYVKGQVEKRVVLNRFGLFLSLFVLGRLLIVEVWDMQLAWRIVTFFAIGLLLIGSVLMRKSKV